MVAFVEHKHAQVRVTVVLQRVLDIRFVPAVLDNIKRMEVQGATFEGEKNYVNSKE